MMKKIIALAVMGLFLLGSIPAPTVLASETQSEEPLQLSLEQATERALKYSKSLQSADIDVDIAYDSEDDYSWNPEWETTYTAGTETAYSGMLTADYNYESATIQKEVEKESVIAQTRQSYYDLLEAIDKVAVKNSSLAADEASFKISEATANVGMLSSIAFDQARIQYNQSQADLVSAENDLNNAYISFNQLVGLDEMERPVLTDTPAMENLEVADLDAQIKLTVSNSPSLDLAYKGIQLKEDITGYTGMTDTADNQIDQAQLSASQLKEQTVKGLYNVYYSIKSLEESYPIAQKSVTLAEYNLRIAQLKYEIGMGTQSDVISAESSLKSAQNSLLSVICNHDILIHTFYKPWAS